MESFPIHIIVIIINILFSACRNDIETSKFFNGKVLKEEANKKEEKNKAFNIIRYKQGLDSLINNIIGKGSQSKLITDTLVEGEMVFSELQGTPLAYITSEAQSSIRYSFPLAKGDRKLKHCLIILTFRTAVKADSVFATFNKVGLEKSGVPGLTYTNDYLVQCDNKIYWINSNCSYAYDNHCKFVDVFRGIVNTAGKTAINCECGKVQCSNS